MTNQGSKLAKTGSETAESALGDTSTCARCRKPIVYETRHDPGFLPRTGWSDSAPSDALVCFSSIDYRHLPIESVKRRQKREAGK